MILDAGMPLQGETYEVIRELGRGGMGVTYLAEHKGLRQTQVIKVLNRDVENKAARQQFELEAQLLAAVDRHPNLPVVHNYFVEHDRPFLVMEYIEGQSLQNRCNDNTPPKIEDILRWTKDLLVALAHLHQRAIIHRDIKPANIIIRPDGTAVLLDFGLARRLDHSHTRTGAQGISDYFAPIEQYHGDSILRHLPSVRSRVEKLRNNGFHTGPYSDIYSLGATLYFALTLNLPNNALYRLQDASLPLLGTTEPELLSTAVTKAMAVEPQDRFQSAIEMLDFLKPLLEAGQIPVSTDLISSHTKQARPRRFIAEDLPDIFVPRLTELESILGLLLESSKSSNNEKVATVTIRGAGGYGKTTLAKAIAHDSRIYDQFPDGILWVTLGKTPNLMHSMIKILTELTGEPSKFMDLEDAAYQLAQALEKQHYLLILDDVWDPAHVRPFMRGGADCARLITTRQNLVLSSELVEVPIAEMIQSEAVTLLCAGIPDGEKLAQAEALHHLTVRLGRYPLLLKLANGVLRHRLNQGQPLAEALIFMEHALDKRGVTAFDTRNTTDREQAVAHTLGLSFEMLEPDEYSRFGELAIFPQDVDIPLATVCKWWAVTGSLDEFEVEELCDRLFRLSLLLHFDLSNRVIRLHSVIRDYLVQQHSDHLPGWQMQFLDSSRPTTPSPLLPNSTPDVSWADLPADEPYLWTNLAYHLVEAKRAEELVATVKELRYLAIKSFVNNVHVAEADLAMAEEYGDEGRVVQLLRRSFVRCSHLLSRCNRIGDLAGTLHCRLQHMSELSSLVSRFADIVSLPYLKIRHSLPLPDLEHPALIRTLTQQKQKFSFCDVSNDGKIIISTSENHTIKLWDSQTGLAILTFSLKGSSTSPICALSSDGGTVVFSEGDKLKSWDIQLNRERWIVPSGLAAITCIALSNDSKIVSADNQTIKVWDGHTGEIRLTIDYDGVTHCTISNDGKKIFTVRHQTINVWDAETGGELFSISTNHAEDIADFATDDSGRLIVSASLDGTLEIWDGETGQSRATIKNDWPIEKCDISGDGNTIVFVGHNNKAAKLWDIHSKVEKLTLVHAGRLIDCAINATGNVIVTISDDATLKIWDGQIDQRYTLLQEYTSASRATNGCDITPDGNIIVTGSGEEFGQGELVIWDGQTGNIKHFIKQPTEVRACAISANGRYTVSTSGVLVPFLGAGNGENFLNVWHTINGKRQFKLAGHSSFLFGCAISGNGKTLVSTSNDRVVKVWDGRTGKLKFNLVGHSKQVDDCAITPNGRIIVSASGDNTAKVWNGQNGQLLHTLEGHKGFVLNCSISADGNTIVTASIDRTLKVWDGRTGQARYTLTEHNHIVGGCAISADGKLMCSASTDQSLKIWNADTGQCLLTFPVEGALYNCACSADGRYIVAVGHGGVYFFELVK